MPFALMGSKDQAYIYACHVQRVNDVLNSGLVAHTL